MLKTAVERRKRLDSLRTSRRLCLLFSFLVANLRVPPLIVLTSRLLFLQCAVCNLEPRVLYGLAFWRCVITIAISKKKKRRHMSDRAQKRLRQDTSHAFLNSLEAQGMLKIAATPDEVNHDLMLILQAVDSARLNGTQLPPHRVAGVERSQDVASRATTDKIHSSRGILHFHEYTFEKGDRVVVCTPPRQNASRPTMKYMGVILSVNAKEVHITADDGLLL